MSNKNIHIQINTGANLKGFTDTLAAVKMLKKQIGKLNGAIIGGHRSRTTSGGNELQKLSQELDSLKAKYESTRTAVSKPLEVKTAKTTSKKTPLGTQSFLYTGGLKKLDDDLTAAQKEAAALEKSLDKALAPLSKKPSKGGTAFIRRRGGESIAVSIEEANKRIEKGTEERKRLLKEQEKSGQAMADAIESEDLLAKENARIAEEARHSRNKEQSAMDAEEQKRRDIAAKEDLRLRKHNKTAKLMGEHYMLSTEKMKRIGEDRVKQIEKEVKEVERLVAEIENRKERLRRQGITDPKIRQADRFRQDTGVTKVKKGDAGFMDFDKKQFDLIMKHGLAQKEAVHVQGMMRAFMGDVKNFMRMQIRWFSSAAIIFAVPSAIAAAIRSFSEFEQAIKDIGAVTGATDRELAQLAETAKEVASITPQSASEVAAMARTLVQAGLEVRQVSQAMLTIAKVATVAGEEMDVVAKTFTTAIFAWKMAAEESDKIGNVLAATLNFSRLQIEDLGTAYNYLASVASQFNLSFAETNAVLATFSNIGVRATTAGTSLVQAITQMTSRAPLKFKEFIGEDFERISRVFESDSPTKFADAIEILENKSLTASKAMRLFELRAGRAVASALLIGSKALRRMYRRIDETKQLTEGFDKAMEGLSNKTKVMRNQLQLFAVELGTALAPLMKQAISYLSTAAKVLKVFAVGLQTIPGLVAALAVGVAIFSAKIWGAVVALRAFAKAKTLATFSSIPFAGWALAVGTALISVIGAIRGLKTESNLFGDDFKETMATIKKYGNVAGKTALAQRKFNKVWEESGEVVGRAVKAYSEAMKEFEFQNQNLPDIFAEVDAAILSEAANYQKKSDALSDLSERYDSAANVVLTRMNELALARQRNSEQDGTFIGWIDAVDNVTLNTALRQIEEAKRKIEEASQLKPNKGSTEETQLEAYKEVLRKRLAVLEDFVRSLREGPLGGLADVYNDLSAKRTTSFTNAEKAETAHIKAAEANMAKLNKILEKPRSLFDALAEDPEDDPFKRYQASFNAFTDTLKSVAGAEDFLAKQSVVRKLMSDVQKDAGGLLKSIKEDYVGFAQEIADEVASISPIGAIEVETRKSAEEIEKKLATLSENLIEASTKPGQSFESIISLLRQFTAELERLKLSAAESISLEIFKDADKIANANRELAELNGNKKLELEYELAVAKAKKAQLDIEDRKKPYYEAEAALMSARIAKLEEQLMAQDALWLSFQLGAEAATESWRSTAEQVRDLGDGMVSAMSESTTTMVQDLVALNKYSAEEYKNYTEYAKDIFEDFFQTILNKWVNLMAEMYAEWLKTWIKTKVLNMLGGIGSGGSGGSASDYTGPAFQSWANSQSVHYGGMIKKYHRGGLARDEVPAILQTNEGVLSRRGMANLARLNHGALNDKQEPTVNNFYVSAVDAQSFDEYLRKNGQAAVLGIVQEDMRLAGGTRTAMRSFG